MNVAMMQPTFLPWQGFFELIYRSDRFVFCDDYQFSHYSYHHRNRLFLTADRVHWYTIPVEAKESIERPLNQVRIADRLPWRRKMWQQIRHNYCAAPFFRELSPRLEQWLLAPAESLAAQNISFIRMACDMMGIQREFRLSSSRPSDVSRSQRIVDLLRWCDAAHFLSAQGSFGYMKADGVLPVEGIEIRFQDYQPKPYPQVGSRKEFVPYLSVLDALLNVGPDATLALIAAGTERWLTWDDMAASGAKPRRRTNLASRCRDDSARIDHCRQEDRPGSPGLRYRRDVGQP